jgi:hypothetical protein
MVDFDQIYENLDKMTEMKRYKPPTHGYFPTVAEINTYAYSDEFEYMIPYLLWLDECLNQEDREVHKEAIGALRDIVAELCEEN